MTAERPPRTLPIRRWLALALVIIFLVPLIATVAFTVSWVGENPHADRSGAARTLRDGAANWNDPGWRSAMADELGEDGVDFVLTEGGTEIFRTVDDPFSTTGGENEPRAVERVVIAGSEPQQVAYVYAGLDFGPPEEVPIELLPFVGLGALALTLAGIAWFLGRTVLKPLAATSAGARSVAAGNLDIELPTSRVREIAELNSAFETMSAELNASLRQQAELEEERRLLVSAVAHDLRTPLFALRGYLEGISQGVADTPEKQRQYVAVAQEKADELERLIADLFDYTRLEYLDQNPDHEPLDLGDLLGKLVTGMQLQADDRRIELMLDQQNGPITVSGDSHLLTRAVQNLLDNALRHTPSGGLVRVEIHQADGRAVFAVHDTGPGIPEHDLPHIFAPLYRGESSRNRRTGGAGLGLTIARRILLAHGGDLSAGNHPDGGAVFIGTLPVSP